MPTTVIPTVADSSVGDGTVSAPVEYEAITGVLESSDHGPELCLGGMKTSLPPQCGGIGLTNWDWSAIDNVQTANGTTWVDSVFVVGHFDGPEFTIAETHTPTDDDLARLRPTYKQPQTPCPEPAGGWLAQAANAPIDGIEVNSRVGEYVASQPDFAALWVDQTINPAWNDPVAMQDPTALNDPRKLIVVATFTGDLERHETELRQLWPGALCVGLAAISQHDLDAIAAELFENISNGKLALLNGVTLDLLSFSQSGNGSTGSVKYDVVVADPAAQSYLDETYGPGRVVLTGALRPVAGR